MARWQKGTFDHDSSGKPGGSLKGDTTMAGKKKTPAKAAKDLMEGKPVKTADIKAPAKTVQADETPETKTTKPAKKAAAEAQFAKADAAGDVRSDAEREADDIRLGLAAKGGL